MPRLIDITFGPDWSYVVVKKGDNSVPFWSGDIFEENFTAWVNSSKTKQCLAYSTYWKWLVAFEDGSYKMRGHKGLLALLKNVRGPQWISFGPGGSYIFQDAAWHPHWWNIPLDLEKAIRNSKLHLTWATLGKDGSYAAGFEDGSYIWHGVPNHLDHLLRMGKSSKRSNVTSIDRVWLSAFDERYYLEHDHGQHEWSSLGDQYFDAIMSCDAMLKPQDVFYTQESISASFSDGTSIYDTARDLNSGSLSITDLPFVEVFRHHSEYYCTKNRRLWCFRNSGVSSMPVKFVAMPANPGELCKRSEVCIRFKKAW